MIRCTYAFTLALFAMVATPASAEWVKMYEGNLGTSYIDLVTIKQNGNFAQVLQIQDLNEAGRAGEMSRQLLVEYDCKEHRTRVLSYSAHSGAMATGRSLVSENFSESNPGPWGLTPPKSPAETISRNVCSVQL